MIGGERGGLPEKTYGRKGVTPQKKKVGGTRKVARKIALTEGFLGERKGQELPCETWKSRH